MDGETGKAFTYAQLKDSVTKTASGMAKMGIRRDDIITIFCPNCPEFVIAYLAIICIGAIPNPINPLYNQSKNWLLI